MIGMLQASTVNQKRRPSPVLRRGGLFGNPNGFTLLELLITIAVAVILMGLGVPSYQALTQRNRIAAYVNDINLTLVLARSEAVKRGVHVTVCPTEDTSLKKWRHIRKVSCLETTTWSNGWIVFVDADGDGERAGRTEELIHLQGPLDGMTLTLSSDTNSIVFADSGMLSEQMPAGGFTLSLQPPDCASVGRTVTVGMQGSPIVAKAHCEGG